MRRRRTCERGRPKGITSSFDARVEQIEAIEVEIDR